MTEMGFHVNEDAVPISPPDDAESSRDRVGEQSRSRQRQYRYNTEPRVEDELMMLPRGSEVEESEILQRVLDYLNGGQKPFMRRFLRESLRGKGLKTAGYEVTASSQRKGETPLYGPYEIDRKLTSRGGVLRAHRIGGRRHRVVSRYPRSVRFQYDDREGDRGFDENRYFQEPRQYEDESVVIPRSSVEERRILQRLFNELDDGRRSSIRHLINESLLHGKGLKTAGYEETASFRRKDESPEYGPREVDRKITSRGGVLGAHLIGGGRRLYESQYDPKSFLNDILSDRSRRYFRRNENQDEGQYLRSPQYEPKVESEPMMTPQGSEDESRIPYDGQRPFIRRIMKELGHGKGLKGAGFEVSASSQRKNGPFEVARKLTTRGGILQAHHLEGGRRLDESLYDLRPLTGRRDDILWEGDRRGDDITREGGDDVTQEGDRSMDDTDDKLRDIYDSRYSSPERRDESEGDRRSSDEKELKRLFEDFQRRGK